jgi:hypothetical protein
VATCTSAINSAGTRECGWAAQAGASPSVLRRDLVGELSHQLWPASRYGPVLRFIHRRGTRSDPPLTAVRTAYPAPPFPPFLRKQGPDLAMVAVHGP